MSTHPTTTRLHRFHGGLRLPGHKGESAGAIRTCPLPPELVLPLLQHAGAPAAARVEVGQRVRRGERIGEADGDRSAHIHAPASGTIRAIETRPVPNPSRLESECMILAPDEGSDEATLEPWPNWAQRDIDALRARIREAGLVGLGGAAFPTAEKLAQPRTTLILNGAECEPWIACDDALLRQRAADVIRGARVLRRAAGAERAILAIEDSMLEARDAADAALSEHGAGEIELVVVPTLYPEGGERQLIRTLTGLDVPSGGLPRDIGIVVQNVGTAAATWHAVAAGEALTRRIVTVTGPGVKSPGNYEVALGTPIAHLIAQAGGYTERAARLVMGGPLMGLALPHDDFPVVKATNCVLVLDAPLPDPAPELPCIRCGECARVCPAQLLPQQLHWYLRSEHFERVHEFGLADCIECGCCDLVCPSHIPLVQQFRWGKGETRRREREAAAADTARARYESRQARRVRDEAERAQQEAARRNQAATPDAVQAALERARARKASKPE